MAKDSGFDEETSPDYAFWLQQMAEEGQMVPEAGTDAKETGSSAKKKGAKKKDVRKQGGSRHDESNIIGASVHKSLVHPYQLYDNLWELFMECGLLYAVARDRMDKSSLLPELLRIICCATIRWRKPYERIGDMDLVNPKATWCLAGIKRLRTVYRLLNVARQQKLVCGYLGGRRQDQRHIALNIGEILLAGVRYAGESYRGRSARRTDVRKDKSGTEPLRLYVNITRSGNNSDLLHLLNAIAEYNKWNTGTDKLSVKTLEIALEREIGASKANFVYCNDDKQWKIA